MPPHARLRTGGDTSTSGARRPAYSQWLLCEAPLVSVPLALACSPPRAAVHRSPAVKPRTRKRFRKPNGRVDNPSRNAGAPPSLPVAPVSGAVLLHALHRVPSWAAYSIPWVPAISPDRGRRCCDRCADVGSAFAESPWGISPQGAHRTGREPL